MLLLAGGAFAATAARADDSQPFGPKFIVSCTIPDNGDLNPYGIAFVPKDFPSGGKIAPGDVLVANFNASSNLQGTGVTIIKFTPSAGVVTPLVSAGQKRQCDDVFHEQSHRSDDRARRFAQGLRHCRQPPLDRRHVQDARAGSLQVIDRNGNLVRMLMDPMFSGRGISRSMTRAPLRNCSCPTS